MPEISAEVLERLRRFDTPTICNVIELFGVRPRNTGYMDARIKASFPGMPPMVGFAATATFRSSAAPREGDAYGSTELQVSRFAELSGPPVIVFQDLDNPPVGATFGEVMCATYKAFGAVGLITSGGGRDLEQVRALDFPVFTSGAICSHAYCHILHVHVSVHVGGIAVCPDDLLHGDTNGVTTIPREIATDLVDIADEFVAAEGIILDSLRIGAPSTKRLHEAVAEYKVRVGELRARVSRKA